MQLFSLITFIASVQAECDDGFWGTDCNYLCGACLTKDNSPLKCDESSGECIEESGCQTGYSGKDCSTPTCNFGGKADQCGNGNICAAPDSCVCTGLTTRDVDGKCYSLRVAGLKGAGISIVVLIVSILACQGGYKFAHSQN